MTMIDYSRIWTSEWIIIGFFLYLIILARLRPLSGHQRGRVVLVGLVCTSLALMLSQLRLSPILHLARAWLPAIYVLQGYWLSGLFFRMAMSDVEEHLLDLDRWLFRMTKLTELLTKGPRIVLEYFELTYLLAYFFVPASFALFCWLGFREEADNFWTAILIASYGCYGILPWIQTRPPRSLELDSPLDARGLLFRRANLFILKHGTVQVNTFQSGHASAIVAAALALVLVDPVIGAVLMVLAVSLIGATVLGRYRYAADTVLGAMLGIIGWWIGFQVKNF